MVHYITLYCKELTVHYISNVLKTVNLKQGKLYYYNVIFILYNNFKLKKVNKLDFIKERFATLIYVCTAIYGYFIYTLHQSVLKDPTL